jgi:hypothetical protein
MGWSSQLAPHILKSAYRQSRLVFRSAVRSFGSRVTTCKVGGVVIRVGVSSEIEHFRADTYSTKEPETLDWLDRELTEEDIFFDVGANIGLYSLYAAKSKPGCTIFSFEPESQNYARLCKNIALNAVAKGRGRFSEASCRAGPATGRTFYDLGRFGGEIRLACTDDS